ncbi:hypothetical protein ABT115_14595 [Streptomyces sp. NPDC001832]|uniref:DUF6907 domain-containing protein n=1 Tax=Streptomyces sp. NPDC001832 TaxID=3154527 RepID=UPI00331F6D88
MTTPGHPDRTKADPVETIGHLVTTFGLDLGVEQIRSVDAGVVTGRAKARCFVNRLTGQPEQVTCMLSCTADHSAEVDAPEFVRVLSSTLNVMPFSTTIAYRLPHVSIEVMQDSWIEGLDPDGLETVIGTLAERVDQLRTVHAQLVKARAEYR